MISRIKIVGYSGGKVLFTYLHETNTWIEENGRTKIFSVSVNKFLRWLKNKEIEVDYLAVKKLTGDIPDIRFTKPGWVLPKRKT